ncbi:MAG TPA: hypothetical protein VLF60_04960 [Candidatus Saccharimonadales bacterium]|nr:hypothetical protein [Candidatus Saccharimonadales bacterium]
MKKYIAPLLGTARGVWILSIGLFIIGFVLAAGVSSTTPTAFTAKVLVGWVTVGLSTAGLGHFALDALWGKSRPHLYSWLIWSIMNAIVWLNQWSHAAGPGAWSTFMMMVLSAVIFVIALWQWRTGTADHKLTTMDQWCFGGAIASIVILVLYSTGPISILAATITDGLAFASTYRKIWSHPSSEPASNYTLNTIRQSLVIAAIGSYNFVTLAFPVSLIFLNVITVVLIYLCVRQLAVVPQHAE